MRYSLNSCKGCYLGTAIGDIKGILGFHSQAHKIGCLNFWAQALGSRVTPWDASYTMAS